MNTRMQFVDEIENISAALDTRPIAFGSAFDLRRPCFHDIDVAFFTPHLSINAIGQILGRDTTSRRSTINVYDKASCLGQPIGKRLQLHIVVFTSRMEYDQFMAHDAKTIRVLNNRRETNEALTRRWSVVRGHCCIAATHS